MSRRILAALALLATTAPAAHAQFPDWESQRRPVYVPGVATAKAVAVGSNAMYVLLQDGTVLAWGRNFSGELGTGEAPRMEAGVKGTQVEVPVTRPQPIPGLTDVVAIAAGGQHALAVKRDGTVWAWGKNRDGQLGLGKAGEGSRVPVQVPGIRNAVSVAAEGWHSYAVLADGRVLAWGDQLWFDQKLSNVSSPKPIPVPGVEHAVAVRAGSPTLALLKDGGVMAWGNGYLGNGVKRQGTYAASTMPQPVRLDVRDAVAIAAGSTSAGIVRRDGTVWLWGGNDYGALGMGKTEGSGKADKLVPTQVPGVSGAAELALGSASTIVLQDGTIRTWGDGRLGATGRAGTDRVGVPVAVAKVADVVQVAAQHYVNLALTRDGRVLAWGHVLLRE